MTEQATRRPERPRDPIREAKAVQAIRESLATIDPDDETLLIDSIEGETGLFEAIDALLARMAEDQVLIAGTGVVVADLEARAARFAKRIATNRSLIEQAMMIAELEKVERPAATLSLAKRQPGLEVATEADIPAEFWVTGAPKLDRKALAAALKDGRDVPGAYLTNAAPSLTVRVK